MPQVEVDKENDYYMRPASPAHTYDPYADDEHVGVADRSDPYDTYHPESVRRIGPPPPPDFVAREERERSRYHEPGPGADRYSTAQHNPESRWSFALTIHQVRPQEELQQRQQQEQLGVEQVAESAALALLLVLLQPLLLALPQQHAARHPAPRS